MRKEIFKEIEIPAGVEISIDGSLVDVKGPEGEIKREFKLGKAELIKNGNKISMGGKTATKKEKKMINTSMAHLKNMINGVKKKFEYKLKIVSSHFPINVEIKGDEAIIKNFLGEKIPRKSFIPKNVEVKINKDIIDVQSVDKELAGQTAANFETATKIRNRDRRVFQDGIFIINKAGKEI